MYARSVKVYPRRFEEIVRLLSGEPLSNLFVGDTLTARGRVEFSSARKTGPMTNVIINKVQYGVHRGGFRTRVSIVGVLGCDIDAVS